MVKFLHTADWQLGMTRHFLGTEAQPRFSQARIEVIGAIAELAEREHCEFVVVCGDVFETNQVHRQVVVRALEAMAAHPALTFYLLPGNHDPLDASSVFTSPTFLGHRPANVVVLDQPGVLAVAPGVELVAAPFTSKRPVSNPVLDALRSLGGPAPAGTQRVVVGHGGVDHFSPDHDSPTIIEVAALEAELAAGKAHYVALGDRHSATSVGDTGRVWYSGAPEPTDFRETDAGQVLVVSLGDNTLEVEAHQVGTWAFERLDLDVTGPADLDRLESLLHDIPNKSRTIVRLGLRGQLSLTEKARLDEMLAHHVDLFASLGNWESRIDLVVLPEPGDFVDLDLNGFAQRALEDLREAAAGASGTSSTARDALGMLLRLAGGST